MKDQTDQLSFSPLPPPLRAGSGTVQLVTGWEKICSASRRPRSPVKTREPPLLPLPIGLFPQVPCNSSSDQDTSRVFFPPTGAAFKKKNIWFNLPEGSSRPSPTAWCSGVLVIRSGSACTTREAGAPSSGSLGMRCRTPTGTETSQVKSRDPEEPLRSQKRTLPTFEE